MEDAESWQGANDQYLIDHPDFRATVTKAADKINWSLALDYCQTLVAPASVEFSSNWHAGFNSLVRRVTITRGSHGERQTQWIIRVPRIPERLDCHERRLRLLQHLKDQAVSLGFLR